jgi:hypothetical protein
MKLPNLRVIGKALGFSSWALESICPAHNNLEVRDVHLDDEFGLPMGAFVWENCVLIQSPARQN